MEKIKQPFKCLMTGMALAVISSYSSSAQWVTEPEFRWADNITGSAQLTGSDDFMEIDDQQNVISVGLFGEGTLNFEEGTSGFALTAGGIGSIGIRKSDSSGDILWVKELEYDEWSVTGFPMFQVTALSVDKEKGDVYISGIYGDTTVDFDPGSDVYHLEPFFDEMMGMYNPAVFILKLNANGEFEWAKTLDIYNGGGISASAVNSNGNGSGAGIVYFTGSLSPLYDFEAEGIKALDFDPGEGEHLITPNNYLSFAYLLALDADGDFQWVKSLGVPPVGASSQMGMQHMVIDESGDLYCTAHLDGELDVDPGEGEFIVEGNESVSLIKYNGAGEFMWIKQGELGLNVADGVEKPSYIYNWDLAYSQGALYVSYRLNGPVNLDNSIPFGDESTVDVDYYNPRPTQRAGAVAKFDTDGTFVWTIPVWHTDTAARIESVMLSASEGYVYITGKYEHKVDLDPGAEEYILEDGNSFLAMYDTAGTFIWGTDLMDPVGASVGAGYANNIHAVYPNVYYSGRYWDGEVDVDFTDDAYPIAPYEETNISWFITKVSITRTDTSLSIDNAASWDASVYPNPTRGEMNIVLDREVRDATLSIRDILGREMYTLYPVNGNKVTLDLTRFIPGTYFIELAEGANKALFKVDKQ